MFAWFFNSFSFIKLTLIIQNSIYLFLMNRLMQDLWTFYLFFSQIAPLISELTMLCILQMLIVLIEQCIIMNIGIFFKPWLIAEFSVTLIFLDMLNFRLIISRTRKLLINFAIGINNIDEWFFIDFSCWFLLW